ncbi:MAG TPA: hypothetical protein PKM97_13275 [Bacteroidia bacterium]|nr:hypothetical protein [Bacteroidia bacterium]
MLKKIASSGFHLLSAFILVSLLISLSSCSKEESLIEPSDASDISTSGLRASNKAPDANAQALPELFGIYMHPDYLSIGNTASENAFLDYLTRKGGNMINGYARNAMKSSSARSQFAAFCRKAVNSYGVKLITCDVRETSELATWDAFYTSYPDLRTVVAPLTEKEPWVTGDYSGCFALLRSTRAMCNRYGAKFYFYTGWMGKNYSNPQAAVDSMVYYCDGIFLSNYVSVSDYLSTASGYGKWDNRIKYRLDQGSSSYGGITKAAKKFNKVDYMIIELQSLQTSYLFDIYATTGHNRSFFGTMYNDAKALYSQSNSDVLKYTELKGKSLYYQKYVLRAQPN